MIAAFYVKKIERRINKLESEYGPDMKIRLLRSETCAEGANRLQ